MSVLVSILVPIYKVEKYIKECAISLFEQTYKNIEFIFVNDCTPDDSINILQQIIEEYPDRKRFVRIINHEKNRGLSAARNTAVEAATGEFIMHVDSDDSIDLDTVSRCVDELIKNNADVIVFSFKNVFPNKSSIEHNVIPEDITEYVNKIIRRECVVCVCGGLYRRSLYMNYGIRAIEGLNMGEDYVTKPRLLYNAQKAIYIDEPFYHYRHTNEESYTKNFKEKHIIDLSLALSVLHDYFKNVPNSVDYRDTLRVGTLRTKAILWIDWALSGGNKKLIDKIRNLYSEYTSLEGLRAQDKCVLWFADHGFYNLLYLFAYIGLKLKYFLK